MSHQLHSTLPHGDSTRQNFLIAMLAALTIVLVSMAPPPPPVFAQSSTTVQLSPATQTIALGGSATQDVLIQNVANLYGAEVILAFDPARLSVLDSDPIQPGIQIGVGPLLTLGGYFVAVNYADNALGKIDLALTQLNPALPVTGSGTLARINFRTLTAGSATVSISSIMMSDRNGMVIAQNINGVGNIQIPPSGHIAVLAPTGTTYFVFLPLVTQ